MEDVFTRCPQTKTFARPYKLADKLWEDAMASQELIEGLNQQLNREVTTFLRYILHAVSIRGAETCRLTAKLDALSPEFVQISTYEHGFLVVA
jgi:hypothetical protein